MINKLKPKSEFSRNVLTLMTGTTIAQAIPIAISPILTRIYTPEDFGVFALFIAITSIFGSIANGRYELAIMLPKKDEDAINIFALGFIITCVISLLLLLIIVLFNDDITILLKNKDIGVWLYFIPITVFFTGLWNILNYYNNRKKQYKDLAKATIIKSITTAIIQLSVGFIKQGAIGLISGQIISQFFANTKLLKNILKDKILISRISKVKIIALAKKYKDFPKYSLGGTLANILSVQAINILISIFYNSATLGFYSLVQRVLGMPSVLIGSSIGQVFFQQAIKEKQKTGRTIKSFNYTVKKLFMIGVPSFTILFFIIEDLFALVFGEEWRVAGKYAKILIPLFALKFVSSTVSVLLTIWEKQKLTFYIDIFLLIINLILILFLHNFTNYLIVYTIFMSLNYILFLLYFIYLSKGVSNV